MQFEVKKKEWRQVNEKFFEGHIGIVEKAQETSSDSAMHNTVCLCLGMQRNTHIIGNNLIPISHYYITQYSSTVL